MTKQAIVSEPAQSAENGTVAEEKPSIWASILRDVKSSTKKAPVAKSLVVLGDNESGRTTLVAKLQGNDDPKRGAGLEYHYIDVKDDDRDDTPKLGVWILDGDVACSAPLLKFAIKPDSLEDTILILVASMTHPWSLLSTLQKWMALVEEHIDRLRIDPTRSRQMRDRLQYEFQHYVEPNDTSIMLTSSASSTTIKSGAGGGRVPNSLSSVSLASTATLSPTTNGEEQIVLPLADGVLTKSLGIPVIVVISKCDVMPTLEKENDYKDEHFDFMQHHLRKFCLEYGAALFYTSVKEKKNIDKLYKYIVHKCYGYPFTSSAAIVEREAIFIPAGWDNPKKADILLENLHRLKLTDNYADVFVKPVVRRPLQRDNEIVAAEDDQEFLSKLQLTLNRAASPGRSDESATPVLTRPSGTSGAGGSQTPSVAGRPRNQPSTTPGSATAAANEGALANFFNSLLTRKSGGAVTPTGSGTPVAQRQTSQSPTTPSSSKRLQQHPLTFAVTPPPGRTRTPTSHKSFASPVNAESPPRQLSPVVEQQQNRTDTDADMNDAQPSRDSASESINNSNETALKSPAPPSPMVENGSAIPLTPEDTADQSRPAPSSSDDGNLTSALANTAEEHVDAPQSSESTRRASETNSPVRSRPASPIALLTTNAIESENNTIPERRSPSPTDERQIKAMMADDQPSSPLAASTDAVSDEPLAPDTGDLKFDSHETTAVALTSEDTARRSRSPSPTTARKSRSPSPIALNHTEQTERRNSTEAVRSRPPSPIAADNEERARSPSPMSKQRSRSPSPITLTHTEQAEGRDSTEAARSRSPSPVADIQDRSDSPAPIVTESHERARSPSLTQEQEETESPFLPPAQDQQGSRPSSPITSSPTEQTERRNSDVSATPAAEERDQSDAAALPTHQRSRSPSPVVAENRARSRSPSPMTTRKSRSPSPMGLSNAEETERRNSNVSATPATEERDPSDAAVSPSPQRSRSPSPIVTENRARSRSPSPINARKSRSPSPIPSNQIEKTEGRSSADLSRSRSPSPATVGRGQSSTAVSPIQQRSRSPSPIATENQEHASSPSPFGFSYAEPAALSSPDAGQAERRNSAVAATSTQNVRSRSPSPLRKNEEVQPTPSPSEHDRQRSRSPSPAIQQNSEEIRTSSPTTQDDQQRSRSSSPVGSDIKRRNSAASPIPTESRERTRSPSPSQGQQEIESSTVPSENSQQRSRSPSPVASNDGKEAAPTSLEEEHTERRNSAISATSAPHVRSRSPSPAPKSPIQQRSRSPSLPLESPRQRSRSSSPIIEHKPEEARVPSPTAPNNQQRSRSPSPMAATSPILEQTHSTNSPSRNNSRSPLPLSSEHSRRESTASEQRATEHQPDLGHNHEIVRASPLPSPSAKSTDRASPLNSPSVPSATAEVENPPVSPTGLTHSHSLSMITRPNTLPFSPNEHNLDGLYMSNDYDDEDESDQQHNSGPDTGSTEARRSSLLLNDQHTKHGHTPIDPDDILRRLSLVEKARAEDSENPAAEPTTAKDT